MTRLRMLNVGLLGVACVLSGLAWAQAQDNKKSDKDAPARPKSEEGARANDRPRAENDETIQKVDRVLKNFHQFRERVAENNEGVRKEIDRLMKESNELADQRHQMLLLSATLRARSSGSQSESESLDRNEALNRELRTVQAQLRAEVEQAKNQVNQLSNQLEALRDQQTRSASAEAEPKKAHTSGQPSNHRQASAGGDPG